VVVELGRGAGELREGRHQRALGFVQVIEHGNRPSGVFRAGYPTVTESLLQCSNLIDADAPAPRW
jgi:hypothetical protein